MRHEKPHQDAARREEPGLEKPRAERPRAEKPRREVRLRMTWDPESDVAYLYLAETGDDDALGPTLLVEPDDDFAGVVALDFTADDGRAVGLEFQMASECLPRRLLAAAERIHGNAAHRLAERGRRLGPVGAVMARAWGADTARKTRVH